MIYSSDGNIGKYRRYIDNHRYIGDTIKILALNEKISLKFRRYIGYIDEKSVKKLNYYK